MTGSPRDVVVFGEALVDIVHTSAGAAERPGGSPANVAVALGRLARDVTLVTVLGDDDRGRGIREWLGQAGVHALVAETLERTATARADIDDDGGATYTFDLTWTVPAGFALPAARVVHTGSIATTLAPGADVVAAAVERTAHAALVTFDPNLRPALTGGREEAAARVERLVEVADVVKASADDIAWLYPGASAADVARRWCATHAALVVITDGAAGALAVHRSGETRVPSARTTVRDTVGAGDTFMGALIDALLGQAGDVQAVRERLAAWTVDDIAAVLRRCATAAAVTVSREGMDPPTRAELDALSV